MRRDGEFFGETEELVLVYVAAKLKESLRLEGVLDAAGLDYLVEPDTYRGGIIFVTERIGAFFYVREENAEQAREALRTAGYRPYLPGDLPGR